MRRRCEKSISQTLPRDVVTTRFSRLKKSNCESKDEIKNKQKGKKQKEK